MTGSDVSFCTQDGLSTFGAEFCKNGTKELPVWNHIYVFLYMILF